MSSGPQDGTPPGDEQVGSVSEEATKLFAALSGWAREHGPDLADHVDAGAPECDWCPVCRALHRVRATSPEVRDHLAAAAGSLMQAAAGFLASAGAPPEARQPSVEHIDLDDERDTSWPEEES